MKVSFLIILVSLFSLNLHATQNFGFAQPSYVTFLAQRETPIKAYVQMRGQWISGYVFINNGVVTRVQFPEQRVSGSYSLRAQLYQNVRPSYLNPNNPIAVQNNFTHYIDIPNYGRAYFSM